MDAVNTFMYNTLLYIAMFGMVFIPLVVLIVVLIGIPRALRLGDHGTAAALFVLGVFMLSFLFYERDSYREIFFGPAEVAAPEGSGPGRVLDGGRKHSPLEDWKMSVEERSGATPAVLDGSGAATESGE